MKVDFYVPDATDNAKCLHFACRLLEKWYADQKRIYVHTGSLAEAERLDTLLWTYRDDSFLPHNLYSHTDDLPPPIQIGFGDPVPKHQDILLNLAKEIPAFYRQFQQIIEIVFPDPLMQQLARDRFRQYRDQGFDIQTHKVKTNGV